MIDSARQLDADSRILDLWADLYRRGAFRVPSFPGCWHAANDLVKVAKKNDDSAWNDLKESLRLSNQAFAPLADPLAIGLGTHRWLSSQREESYSDWLGWIFEQIGDARLVLELLGMEENDLLQECASEKPTVKRELSILRGSGRLDLFVEFGKLLLVIVEVKTKSFDEEEVLLQLNNYRNWVRDQHQYRESRCYFIAAEPGEFSLQAEFEPLRWRELALRMRETAQDRIRAQNGIDLICAAMIVVFCGAVEQNLLRLSGKRAMFRTRSSAEYLKEWSENREG